MSHGNNWVMAAKKNIWVIAKIELFFKGILWGITKNWLRKLFKENSMSYGKNWVMAAFLKEFHELLQ